MKPKETRGRKGKYPKLALKRGQCMTFDASVALQMSFLRQAKVRGWTLKTWHDEGQLVVLRTK